MWVLQSFDALDSDLVRCEYIGAIYYRHFHTSILKVLRILQTLKTSSVGSLQNFGYQYPCYQRNNLENLIYAFYFDLF